jgi:hypothetical protein
LRSRRQHAFAEKVLSVRRKGLEEHLTAEPRGRFYDMTGALRDMVPNHLFQLLSLVAMEPPARFDARTSLPSRARSGSKASTSLLALFDMFFRQ